MHSSYKAPRMKPNEKKTLIISVVNMIRIVQLKFLFINYMYKGQKLLQ